MVSTRSRGAIASDGSTSVTPNKLGRGTAAAARPGDDGEDLDPHTRFLYSPRSLTTLIIGSVLVLYFSGTLSPATVQSPEESYASSKRGLWAVVLCWLTISAVHGPQTPMVRPHPMFWRIVYGLLVAYLLFALWILFQSVDDARAFMRHLSPELGVELQERHYGGDCSLTRTVTFRAEGPLGPEETRRVVNWEVLRATLFDEFVAAHVIGWWGKALMLRDRSLLWILSAGFELMELTFKHWLPNFNECWWDSWILDFATCNALGIWLGMKSVEYFKSKEYDWRGLSKHPGLWGKARRSALQLTPATFTSFTWAPTSSPLRLVQCLFPTFFFLLFELTGFFLKYLLWIQPTNPLLTYRLFLLLGLGLPAMREFYEYMGDPVEPGVEAAAANPYGRAPPAGGPPRFKKLGSFAWTGVALAVVETAICIKFGRGVFTEPFPKPVVYAWSTFFAVTLTAFSFWTWRFYHVSTRIAALLPGRRVPEVADKRD